MPPSTTHQRKLGALQSRCDELHALLVFSRAYCSEDRHRLETIRREAQQFTNRQLELAASQVERDVRYYANEMRPTRPLNFYVEFLRRGNPEAEDLLFVPRWQLKKFFAGIENVVGGLPQLPQHTLLSLDIHGFRLRNAPGEIKILEASLFEDMCALFNAASKIAPKVMSSTANKREMKESAALRRGALLAAFYTVEAYLNSLAFDYLVENPDKEASPDLDRITEWNHERNREKLVNFRDKLIGYPKIILGLEHPPLQENNCPEMKFLLHESKQFRDSIVHANPRPTHADEYSSKELMFWRIGSTTPISFSQGPTIDDGTSVFEHLERTVDSAIALIEKIEVAVHGSRERLFWLQERTPAGTFDDTVFD